MPERAWLDDAERLLVWTRDNLEVTPGVPHTLVETADRLRTETAELHRQVAKMKQQLA